MTRIEGLGAPDATDAEQVGWIAHQVAQCGCCQFGQITQAAVLLSVNPDLPNADTDEADSGNPRCGTYLQLGSAVQDAVVRSRKLKRRICGDVPFNRIAQPTQARKSDASGR